MSAEQNVEIVQPLLEPLPPKAVWDLRVYGARFVRSTEPVIREPKSGVCLPGPA